MFYQGRTVLLSAPFLADHPDSVFMAYTNATLIDEGGRPPGGLANFSSFSLEGWQQTDARGEQVLRYDQAMDLLRKELSAPATAMRTTSINFSVKIL